MICIVSEYIYKYWINKLHSVKSLVKGRSIPGFKEFCMGNFKIIILEDKRFEQTSIALSIIHCNKIC